MEVQDIVIGGIYNVFYNLSNYTSIAALTQQHQLQSVIRYEMKEPALYTSNDIEMSIKTSVANMRININVMYPEGSTNGYYYYGTKRIWTLRTGLTSNQEENRRFVQKPVRKYSSDIDLMDNIFRELAMLLSAQTSISQYHMLDALYTILIRIIEQNHENEAHWCYSYRSYARTLVYRAKDRLSTQAQSQFRLY